MNRVTILWNITQDMELKQTQNGQSVLSLSIATSKKWTDNDWIKQEKTEFHNCIAWQKTAELIEKFFSKWDKILVEWELQTKSWEAQDWSKRYKTEIVISSFEFCGWNKKKEEFNDTNFDTSTQKTHKSFSLKQDEISIEDIPFK